MQRGALERIAGNGEIGRLLAGLNDRSPLGPLAQWSASLQSTVDLMLASRAEIVLFWGSDFCALYNEAYAPTIGSKHPDVLGLPARDGWRELWDDLGPLLANVRSSGETFHAKDRRFYIERHDGGGEEVFFDISYSPVFDGEDVGGVLCIVSETTARVIAEREALADRTKLWTIARDPFLIADKKGNWLKASPAWTQILGWREDQLVGHSSEWMEHPDDIAATRAEVEDLSAGETTTHFENRFCDVDGNYHWFAWTAVPEGELIYCVARDVTQVKEAEVALRGAEEALRQSQKMETVGHLTGGVAHDFNNLLQIVTGNLDIIQRNIDENQSRVARATRNAIAGAERAAVLTQRLLAFARRQPLAPQHVDPNRLIADMADMLHRTLGETVELDFVRAPRLWPVEVDINQLENALLNLVVNARDAMPEGGRLTIETANCHLDKSYSEREAEVQPGQYMVIAVSDTGQGMDAPTAERAFEPFFTTKEVGRGTGLGLSMVYGFIKQSGGHVRIYSEPGEGTTVKIYLPRATDTPVVRHAVHVSEPPASGENETILVCEDDEGVRAYTVDALIELGYTVFEAAEGPAALAILEQHHEQIDILFTDVVLPGGMTGAALADRAREIKPALPVLFTSGYARNAIVHHGRLDAGVNLLPKPYSYSALAAKLREILD